jgi:putative transposase
MSWYRRANQPGGTYFFTLVTYNRRRYLTDELARNCLRKAWREICEKRPFVLEGVCLLPDHLHCVWKLPEGDNDFSTRWAGIKAQFSRYYRQAGGSQELQTTSRKRTGEASLWQRRFWEHQIRDQEDYIRHMDYIHYNPVKHGIVQRVADWPWSTFHRYVKEGVYDIGWGSQDMEWIDEFGETGE